MSPEPGLSFESWIMARDRGPGLASWIMGLRPDPGARSLKLSLINIIGDTRLLSIPYAFFCL